MCEKANKKTLSPEHVVAALQELGFGDFVGEVEAHWHQVKEEAQVIRFLYVGAVLQRRHMLQKLAVCTFSSL